MDNTVTQKRTNKKGTYWYMFYEEVCVLCGRYTVDKCRVYDKPKPKDYGKRHKIKETACWYHFF